MRHKNLKAPGITPGVAGIVILCEKIVDKEIRLWHVWRSW
jgi:hypothetical protein